jgi:hypothetical protein
LQRGEELHRGGANLCQNGFPRVWVRVVATGRRIAPWWCEPLPKWISPVLARRGVQRGEGDGEMVEFRNKVVNIPAGGMECVISSIGKDGFGRYQLYEDIYFNRHKCKAVAGVEQEEKIINFAFFRMSSFRAISSFRRKIMKIIQLSDLHIDSSFKLESHQVMLDKAVEVMQKEIEYGTRTEVFV